MTGTLASTRIRATLASRAPRVDLAADAFAAQAKFIADPAPLKYAFCTRRAAKSYAVGLEHMASAQQHGGKHLIIGLTRESVRGAFWTDVLKDIDAKHALGWRFNETRLEAVHASGGSIRLLGMDSNDNERRKALGQKYRRVAIDEAQDFRTDLEQLVYSALKPAVADYQGSISLTGTPSNLIQGFYFKLTTGAVPGWSRHQWTTFDNPHMARQWQAEIDQLKAANPRVVEVPWFRQNYLGEWVVEDDRRVYRYVAGRNDYAALPVFKKGAWHYVLGCDLGYNDPTAWVVCAWHDFDRTLYVVDAFKESGLDVTAVAVRTRALCKRYDFEALVIDNANKQAVEEMRRRHDLPWRAADKTGKADFIEIMNGEYILGNVKLAPKCEPLADEYAGLIWDDKASVRAEHPASPNHCCFVAGTMVLTEHGERPIETLRPGDLVHTRQGLRPVTHAFSVGERDVLDLGPLRGTADHPVWTQRGWVRLDSVVGSDALLYASWDANERAESNSQSGTASGGGAGLMPSADRSGSTSSAIESICTEPSGRPLMVRFRWGTTSTTSTATPTTTPSTILSASRSSSMSQSTGAPSAPRPLLRGLIGSATLLAHGTGHPRGVHGTQRTALAYGSPENGPMRSAWSAESYSAQGMGQPSAVGHALLDGVALLASTTSNCNAPSAATSSCGTDTPSRGAALGPAPLARRIGVSTVYNLTVADAHEYVANGVLVSNCDAALYAWRYCYAFLSEKPADKPVVGTPEYEDALEQQDEEREEQKRREQEEVESWM